MAAFLPLYFLMPTSYTYIPQQLSENMKIRYIYIYSGIFN